MPDPLSTEAPVENDLEPGERALVPPRLLDRMLSLALQTEAAARSGLAARSPLLHKYAVAHIQRQFTALLGAALSRGLPLNSRRALALMLDAPFVQVTPVARLHAVYAGISMTGRVVYAARIPETALLVRAHAALPSTTEAVDTRRLRTVSRRRGRPVSVTLMRLHDVAALLCATPEGRHVYAVLLELHYITPAEARSSTVPARPIVAGLTMYLQTLLQTLTYTRRRPVATAVLSSSTTPFASALDIPRRAAAKITVISEEEPGVPHQSLDDLDLFAVEEGRLRLTQVALLRRPFEVVLHEWGSFLLEAYVFASLREVALPAARTVYVVDGREIPALRDLVGVSGIVVLINVQLRTNHLARHYRWDVS